MPIGTVIINTNATVQLVAPSPDNVIKVVSYFFVVSGASTITFQDSDGNALTGPMAFGANGGMVLSENSRGWFRTPTAKGLKIAVSGGNAGGALNYDVE